MSQVYYSPMTVGGAQVPSTQTNFPKLSFPTDNRFKTISNGGHVANANGYDIRPYADSALTTPLTYELVYYNASTGQFEMHVNIPSLSNGYVTYFGYGDSGISTDGSSTTTWSNSFVGVYHLKDGTTLSVADSTGVSVSGNHGVTAATGQIDGAGGFVAASLQYIDTGALTAQDALTTTAWLKATSFPTSFNWIYVSNNASVSQYFAMGITSAGKLSCQLFANADVHTLGTTTLSTATWYFVSMSYDSSAGLKGYVNATSDGTAAANGNIKHTNTPTILIGADPNGGINDYWNGSIDEVRVASVARSPDWITTEYNNQSAPGTFETLGAEVQVVPPVGLYTI